MQSKKYQCYNINVQTLVVYATIVYATTKVFVVCSFRYAKNLPKTLSKNSPKTPPKIFCGDKNLL